MGEALTHVLEGVEVKPYVKIYLNDSTNGQYYFTIVASNYKTLATSETYWNKSDCRSAAELIKREASSATILDMTKSKV